MLVAGVAMLVLALVAVVMVLASAGLRDDAEQESEEASDKPEAAERPGGGVLVGGMHCASR